MKIPPYDSKNPEFNTYVLKYWDMFLTPIRLKYLWKEFIKDPNKRPYKPWIDDNKDANNNLLDLWFNRSRSSVG